ncbi:MAG: 2-nonaprenyl-3-methyl-6-methoxy-1,4-benzoquinol hydroxylase [Lysobacteraceae bacterium]|nr:MAG: 2-nonaprenyl-3-methyl-6-methoxy-1,4-benzoquinol hydroxylase [Xanthomonadaceae bacterium]
MRQYGKIDQLLMQLDQGLRTSFSPQRHAERPSPAIGMEEGTLSEQQRKHAAGLMRINHTGEVCAQALYYGQAATAKDEHTKQHMEHAAVEETDHLVWCEQRLDKLDASPSVFNPAFYAGSFAIGALAGLSGDRTSYGFVVETERQVEAHLEGHLQALPQADQASLAVVQQMMHDEARHADEAEDQGGQRLPRPVQGIMQLCANVMREISYRW